MRRIKLEHTQHAVAHISIRRTRNGRPYNNDDDHNDDYDDDNDDDDTKRDIEREANAIPCSTLVLCAHSCVSIAYALVQLIIFSANQI